MFVAIADARLMLQVLPMRKQEPAVLVCDLIVPVAHVHGGSLYQPTGLKIVQLVVVDVVNTSIIMNTDFIVIGVVHVFHLQQESLLKMGNQ